MVGLRATFACALAVLLAVAVVPSLGAADKAGQGGEARGGKGKPRPNVVVIVTDDQTLESYRRDVMPKTVAALGDRGTTFTQAIVSTPQCCPSRAGYLTGQYSHNNGVIANQPGYSLLRRKKDVLPSWMRAAGYRTVHIGKYLNGYGAVRDLRPAPGWDRWYTLVDLDYRAPAFSKDGDFREPDRYLTSVINQQAERTIRRFAPRRKPLFLQIDQFAPHVGDGDEGGRCNGGPVPLPRDEHSLGDLRAPVTPATSEEDVSDKPEFIQRQAPLDTPQEKIDLRYACALESLAAVDRGVAGVVRALRRSGELSRTMIVFTSDNGYSWAEHRVTLDKGMPYEEHLRVPLVIRPPKSFPRQYRSGARVDAPVANVDLAPTFLGLARGEPCRRSGSCRRLDGRTLLPLLHGAEPGWTRTRAIKTSFSINFKNYSRSCVWTGFRTPSQSVIEHLELPAPGGTLCRPADEYENYDLGADPWQLENLGTPGPDTTERLDSLSRCSGIRGRDEPRASTPFCE